MSTPAITIREMKWGEHDLLQILQIEESVFNEYDAYQKDDFFRWYGYNPDLFLVAEIDDRIVGYVITRILSRHGDLASLAIHPAYHRMGIGSALLAATEQKVKGYGKKKITLEVRKTNLTGLFFWKQMGFVEFGRHPGFYEDGEEAILMMKSIP